MICIPMKTISLIVNTLKTVYIRKRVVQTAYTLNIHFDSLQKINRNYTVKRCQIVSRSQFNVCILVGNVHLKWFRHFFKFVKILICGDFKTTLIVFMWRQRLPLFNYLSTSVSLCRTFYICVSLSYCRHFVKLQTQTGKVCVTFLVVLLIILTQQSWNGTTHLCQ